MATIYFYKSIEPKTAISIYADYKGGFLFGTPGTTVKDLRVRFWKLYKITKSRRKTVCMEAFILVLIHKNLYCNRLARTF